MADEYRFNAEQHKLLENSCSRSIRSYSRRSPAVIRISTCLRKRSRRLSKSSPPISARSAEQVVLTAYQLLGKGKLLLGRKESCAWMGLSLGNAYGGDSRRQLQQRDRASVRLRLFGVYRLGILQPEREGQYIIGHGGGASAQHNYCTPISWNNAKPGDLVFYPGDSHVGDRLRLRQQRKYPHHPLRQQLRIMWW